MILLENKEIKDFFFNDDDDNEDLLKLKFLKGNIDKIMKCYQKEGR